MALVSSTLNPDAPLFIPAAFRQAEDFSPEWWQLITKSAWYHNYWLSLNPDGFNECEDEDIHGENTVDSLPDSFDLGAGEDFSVMEAQYEEFLLLSEIGSGKAFPFASNRVIGDAWNAGVTKQSIVKPLNLEGLGRKAVAPVQEREFQVQPPLHSSASLNSWERVCVYFDLFILVQCVSKVCVNPSSSSIM